MKQHEAVIQTIEVS